MFMTLDMLWFVQLYPSIWYYSRTWGKLDVPWPKQSRRKTAVDEIYNEILLYKTLLHFEPIPILRPRLPGNFTRIAIGPEGCAQKIDSSRARLWWNVARNSCDVKWFSIEYHCRCRSCITMTPGLHQFEDKSYNTKLIAKRDRLLSYFNVDKNTNQILFHTR